MYDLLKQEEADRIKLILETSELLEPIQYNFLHGKYSLDVFDISESYDASEFYGRNMRGFNLLNKDEEPHVLKYRNSIGECFVHYGEWAYYTRLREAHITVGCSKHNYNFQIELSQAITDENHIYIVKNISNLAGKGALVRLYRNLKDDRASKEKRKQKFIEDFNSKIIPYKRKDWIVISTIKKEDLYNDEKSKNIMQDILSNILKAMLLVEVIGEEF